MTGPEIARRQFVELQGVVEAAGGMAAAQRIIAEAMRPMVEAMGRHVALRVAVVSTANLRAAAEAGRRLQQVSPERRHLHLRLAVPAPQIDAVPVPAQPRPGGQRQEQDQHRDGDPSGMHRRLLSSDGV